MRLMSQIFTMSELITVNCLLISKIISMELRIFGIKQNVIYVNSMAFQNKTFIFILRSVNSGLIMGHQKIC